MNSEQELYAKAAAKNIWAVWVESDARYKDNHKDVYHLIGALASDAQKRGMTMSVKDWIFPFDQEVLDVFGDVENMPKKILSSVLSMNRTIYLDSDFKRSPISWEIVPYFPQGASRDVPIMWTRGLTEEGVWDITGVFGERGGIVVFADGRMRWYDSLKDKEGNGLLKKYGTNESTSNIREAIAK